jgi:hypothetical protein
VQGDAPPSPYFRPIHFLPLARRLPHARPILGALAVAIAASSCPAAPVRPRGVAGVRPGRILVKFRSDATDADRRGAIAAVGAAKVGAIRGIGVSIAETRAGRSTQAVEALKRNPRVQYAERDGLLEAH